MIGVIFQILFLLVWFSFSGLIFSYGIQQFV